LRGDVRRDAEERASDQAKGEALAGAAAARELPDDDGRGADLDERVQAEAREGDRARTHRSAHDDDRAHPFQPRVAYSSAGPRRNSVRSGALAS
jgi:hypothetical protein